MISQELRTSSYWNGSFFGSKPILQLEKARQNNFISVKLFKEPLYEENYDSAATHKGLTYSCYCLFQITMCNQMTILEINNNLTMSKLILIL